MKLCKIILTANVPQRKCGADAAVSGFGSLLGFGASMLNGSLSAETSMANQILQMQENQKNRTYQSIENVKAREWAENEWTRQHDITSEQWYGQQDYMYHIWKQQQEYNSPQAILNRYSQAGLNGALMMQGQSPGSSGGLSPAPVSAPSTPSAPMGSPSTSPLPQRVSVMSGILDGVVKLSEAAEKSAHSKEMWDLIRPKIRDYLSRSSMQEYTAMGLELDQEIKRAKFPKELKILSQEYLKAIEETHLTAALTGKADSERLLNIAKKIESYANSRVLSADAQLTLEQLAWYGKRMQSELDTNKSEQDKNRAQAREAASNAESNEFMLSIQKEPKVRNALCAQIQQAAEIAKSQKLLTDKQADNIKWQTEQLKKATDNYEIMMWSNIINQSINTAANAIGEFTKFGLAKKFLQAPSSSSLQSGQGYMMQDGVLMLNPVR